MSSPQPVPTTLGAENQLALEATADADPGVENLYTVDDESSSDEEMDTDTSPGLLPASSPLPRHRPGASSSANCSSCQPSCFGQCSQIGSQVDLKALFDAQLEATGKEVQRIGFLVDFVGWISRSDFLSLQQPEPVVGDSSLIAPAAVEEHGIRGQSVYTCLFHHLCMETFTCKFCSHIEENLEDAIIHQRSAHFQHYPYLCSPTHAQCGRRFASETRLVEHQNNSGH